MDQIPGHEAIEHFGWEGALIALGLIGVLAAVAAISDLLDLSLPLFKRRNKIGG